ncbi:hypothetical protein WS57_25665 [Burkholderia pseudomultivorans]|nr:hypothetical protein WS57_25665 [Burkholderia pseudomultivorans]
MRTEATHVICCPTSKFDGKRVRVIAERWYDIKSDSHKHDVFEVELVDTGERGAVPRRFLAEVR